jgi:hypothetical protein
MKRQRAGTLMVGDPMEALDCSVLCSLPMA